MAEHPENRIREHRERLGISLEKLAEEVGTSNQQISMLERSKRGLTLDWMLKIAPKLKVRTSDLLPIETNNYSIPLAGQVNAGRFVPPNENMEWSDPIDVPLPIKFVKLRPYALKVVGSSMNLVFPEGTLLICSRLACIQEAPVSGKKYIIEHKNPAGDIETTVKEFVLDEHGKPWAWPRSSDPKWQSPVRLDDNADGHSIEIVARVIYSIKPE